MLTSSTTIVHQKAPAPTSPINGYGPASNLHHPVLEPNLMPQPQSQAAPLAVHANGTLAQESSVQSTYPAVLGPAVSHSESHGSSPTRIKHPQPQEQEQKRQSTLHYFPPKDSSRRLSFEESPQGLMASGGDNNTTTTTAAFAAKGRQQQQDMNHRHHHHHHSHHHQDDTRLVVRLDLRKLGSNGTEVRPSGKKLTSQRHSTRKKSLDGPIASIPSGGQTTLGAHSWTHTKPVQDQVMTLAQNGSHDGPQEQNRHIDHLQQKQQQQKQPQPQPQQQQQQHPTTVSIQDATLTQKARTQAVPVDSLLQPPITTNNAIDTTRSSIPDSELRGVLQSEGDPDYVDTGSRSMKRSNSSGSWTDQSNKKRTRSSNQGNAKMKKVQEEGKAPQESQHQEGPALKKKGSLKQMVKKAPVVAPSAPGGPAAPTPVAKQFKDIAVAGNGAVIDHNNDYCEACAGLGQFICCDSCPRAFHFSCCQPPVDPLALPDEWNCNECQAIKYPPKPRPPGIFKQLLDNINRTNPKAFTLPSDIQLFFKGVVANSDGEYEDVVDYKPRPKRSTTSSSSSTPAIKADSEALQLQDSHGQIRLCFQCGKSALRDRFMVSCDHCPLHWHLDCLSPPLASPPPSTNKWMCPNHADHVMPRRRKRKDATLVELKDPRAANDGLIEVIPDPEPSAMSLWNQDTSGTLFRVPERNIKQGFVEKCQRIRELQLQQQQQHQRNQPQHQQQQQTILPGTQLSTNSVSITIQPFDMLVAAAMADDRLSDSSSHPTSSLPKTNSRDRIQESVLSRMTDPAERQEYQRFLAFQRYLRELGSEEAMKRWLEQQEREKEEIARQGLLELQ
ncbi:hypothetical protein BGX33_008126 [Mortierella sp. NVP41]|nr:hypothetical protein BGX33_008126 [Mortierella sp. NVP41]